MLGNARQTGSAPLSTATSTREKHSAEHSTAEVNKSRRDSGVSEELEVDHEEAALLRKIDMTLLPILSLLYACAVLDRVNISAARVDGMGKALGLNDPKHNYYSVALLCFFPTYFLFEVPSNVFLRRIGTRKWLSIVSLAFGLTSIGAGFVKSWQMLAFCRAVLGACEGSFFSGAVFLISCWYKRYELQVRVTAFFMAGGFFSAFSGLIAYGVSHLDGKAGLAGWRWIFICEGIATCFFAIIAIFLISDFPQDALWLNNRQRELVVQRLDEDRKDVKNDHKIITVNQVLGYLREWKIWTFAIMYGCGSMSAYAMAYFTPIILEGMGYRATQALLLTSPPYITAIVYGVIISYISDRTRRRAVFIIFNCILIIAGLLIVSQVHPAKVRYFGIFLAVTGANVNIPMAVGFASNNMMDNGRRAVAVAIQTGWGAIGGIIASTVFRQHDAPEYIPGLWTAIGLTILMILMMIAHCIYFAIQNAKADEGKVMIYDQPEFRYTL